MRPKAIRQAEGVYAASIVLLLVGAALQWQMLSASVGVAATAGAAAFSLGLWSLLLLFATRRGRSWARWGLTVVTAFAVLAFLWQIAQGLVPLGLIGTVQAGQVVLVAIGAVLLFRPAAGRWFARPHVGWEENS